MQPSGINLATADNRPHPLVILSSLPSAGEALGFHVHYVSCDDSVVNPWCIFFYFHLSALPACLVLLVLFTARENKP
jgi:hypothetical protein